MKLSIALMLLTAITSSSPSAAVGQGDDVMPGSPTTLQILLRDRAALQTHRLMALHSGLSPSRDSISAGIIVDQRADLIAILEANPEDSDAYRSILSMLISESEEDLRRARKRAQSQHSHNEFRLEKYKPLHPVLEAEAELNPEIMKYLQMNSYLKLRAALFDAAKGQRDDPKLIEEIGQYKSEQRILAMVLFEYSGWSWAIGRPTRTAHILREMELTSSEVNMASATEQLAHALQEHRKRCKAILDRQEAALRIGVGKMLDLLMAKLAARMSEFERCPSWVMSNSPQLIEEHRNLLRELVLQIIKAEAQESSSMSRVRSDSESDLVIGTILLLEPLPIDQSEIAFWTTIRDQLKLRETWKNQAFSAGISSRANVISATRDRLTADILLERARIAPAKEN